MPKYMTVTQVAETLNVSERTIRNYVHRGVRPGSPLASPKLRAIKFGRAWRISEADLAAFAAAVATLGVGVDG